jgi:hypothetical protein
MLSVICTDCSREESKPPSMGVHGASMVDCVTECGPMGDLQQNAVSNLPRYLNMMRNIRGKVESDQGAISSGDVGRTEHVLCIRSNVYLWQRLSAGEVQVLVTSVR